MPRIPLLSVGTRRLLAGLAAWAWSAAADAHVKWFAPFDIAGAPRPLNEVIDGNFVYMFLGAVALTYAFFLADRIALREGLLAGLDARLRQLDTLALRLMHLSAAVFFLSLWGWYQFTGTSFFLTPELKTSAPVVPWLQLALGLLALWPRTLPLVGAGIFGLYLAAAQAYGLYHLLDYVIFLGIACFFLVAQLGPGWRKSGFVTLFATTGITLIWASVEKFAYPQWTYELLRNNPAMLMGMAPPDYMALAGFVEFTVTFLLLGAASVGVRLVAFGLEAIFVLAIYKFGMVDAIGHLMIIAILTVMVVRGPTSAREMLVLRGKSVWTEAYFMTGLFYLAFVTIFILYYGLHYQFYGR